MRRLASLLVVAGGCGFHVAPLGSGPDDDGGPGGESDPTGDAMVAGCIRDLDATRMFSCAVRTDGTAWCWGDNAYQQLGDSTTINRATPVRVGALADILQIATASRMTYALDSSGVMWAWGLNDVGQLGDGTQTDHGDPRAVPGLANVVQIDAGRGHVCALTASNNMSCWGFNTDQQVGNGAAGSAQFTPFLAATNVVQMSVEGRHGCARLATDEIRCWGDNIKGELGLGTLTNDEPPTTIPGGFRAIEIAAGGRHTCARKSDRTVWCWGDNRYGQIGQSTATLTYDSPVQVPGIDDATELIVGGRRSCARRANGEVWCWGETIFGMAGTSMATIGNEPPHAISDLAGAGAIAISAYHECAAHATEVRCVGRNSHGQLGDATMTSTTTYVATALPCN